MRYEHRSSWSEPAFAFAPTRASLVAALIFIAVYAALDLNKLYALRYGADTGTFLQWLANEAHGRGSWNAAEYRPHLQVHDSWALLGLVPFVAVAPFAQTLLILQIVAVAAAGPALAGLARACGAASGPASAVAVAYLLSPSAQGLAYGNFLENVFVPLLGASAAIAVRRRSLLTSLVVAQLLLGLKEDEALFLMWLGAACALWWDRRIGVAIAVLAGVNGTAFVALEHLHRARPSIPAYGFAFTDPLGTLALLAGILAPFAFAPLWFGWRALLVIPFIVEIAFNRPWAYPLLRLGTHWTAPLVTVVALAAAYVVAERPGFARPMIVLAALCALTINDTALKIGRWPYVIDWAVFGRAAALRAAPHDVTVPRSQEGVYALAASNPHVRLAGYDPHESGYCPAYDTNARAFFASLHLGTWPSNLRLCGGVPVPSR